MRLHEASVFADAPRRRSGLRRFAAALACLVSLSALGAWQGAKWLGQDAHEQLREIPAARAVALDASLPKSSRVNGMAMLAEAAIRAAEQRAAALDALREIQAQGGELGQAAARYLRHVEKKERKQ